MKKKLKKTEKCEKRISGARFGGLPVLPEELLDFAKSKEFVRVCNEFQTPCLLRAWGGGLLSLREFRRRLRPNRSFHTFAPFFQIFFILGAAQKIIKNRTSINPPKISNIRPLDAQSQIWEPFQLTFGIICSINFPDRLNLVICNNYNAKTSFLRFQASYFSIKNRSKIYQHIMFFQSRFLDLLFLIIFRIVSKIVDFGHPFKIQWGQTWRPKSTKGRQKTQTKHKYQLTFALPVFTKPKELLCRWDIVAFKRSLFRWRLANFLLSLRFFVLCFIFFPSYF